jgi:hypothetical protein
MIDCLLRIFEDVFVNHLLANRSFNILAIAVIAMGLGVVLWFKCPRINSGIFDATAQDGYGRWILFNKLDEVVILVSPKSPCTAVDLSYSDPQYWILTETMPRNAAAPTPTHSSAQLLVNIQRKDHCLVDVAPSGLATYYPLHPGEFNAIWNHVDRQGAAIDFAKIVEERHN